MSHIYAPDTSKEWVADEEGMSYVPCKLCGMPPGGDHRELEDPVMPKETLLERLDRDGRLWRTAYEAGWNAAKSGHPLGDSDLGPKIVEDPHAVGERVRYVGGQLSATHDGQVGTVMQIDEANGLKWVQFDDDTIAPQGWVPAADLESYVPTEIVEKVFEKLSNIGKGSYQLGKEMTEEMFGGPVEPGPDPSLDGKVVQFPPTPISPNLRCSCGSEWWITSVVIENGRVTGYTPDDLRCRSCGEPPEEG